MISSTGTSLNEYLQWLSQELDCRKWGEVSIRFIICNGQIVTVRKESIETEQYKLKKQ